MVTLQRPGAAAVDAHAAPDRRQGGGLAGRRPVAGQRDPDGRPSRSGRHHAAAGRVSTAHEGRRSHAHTRSHWCRMYRQASLFIYLTRIGSIVDSR